MVRALIESLLRFALHTFYRVRRLGGELPTEGPVLLVANHPNGLVDPVMVLAATRRPLRSVGKAPLLAMPVIGWIARRMGLIPVHRPQDGGDPALNDRAFAAVREALEQGTAIAVFPEGRSHDEPAVQRLKTGAARMALAADPARAGEVRIVPVGLVYAAKGRFRSKAAIWVGEPVDGSDLRADANDPERSWSAVEHLTARVDAALREVTINLESWKDWDLLRLAQRLWRPARGPERVERLALLARAASDLRARDPERLAALARRVHAFQRALSELGLPADRLDQRYRPAGVARYLARELTTLVVGLPLAAAATLYWLPPLVAIRIAVRACSLNADIEATAKVLAAGVLMPLWLAVTSVLLGLELGLAWGLALALAAPVLGRLALPVVEDHLRLAREVRQFVRHGTSPGLRRALLAEREALAAEFEALAATR